MRPTLRRLRLLRLLRLLPVLVLTACTVVLVGATAPSPAAGCRDDLDRVLERVVRYEFGESRRALNELAAHVRLALADPAKRASVAKRLAPILADGEATAAARRFVARQLGLVAGDAEIAALVAAIGDDVTGHFARAALERIGTPAADAALRDALGKHGGAVRIGLINALGDRRDAKAIDAFTAMLDGEDLHAARAAAEALAKIGTPGAANVLAAAFDRVEPGLREALAWARFECAERCAQDGEAAVARSSYASLFAPGLPVAVCTAAFRRLVASDENGLRLVTDTLAEGHPTLAAAAAHAAASAFPGDAVTDRLLALVPRLSPARRTLLVRALGLRGDRRARLAAVAAATSDDPKLRAAGLEALGSLGTAADALHLIEHLGEKDTHAEIARRSLDRLPDEGANAVIEAAIGTTDGARRVEVIRCAAARRCEGATGALFEALKDKSGKCRRAAYGALGILTRPEDIPRLVDIVSEVTGGDAKHAARALAEACRRIDDERRRAAPVLTRLESGDAATRCALLPVLARIGGDAALTAVREAVGSDAAEVREAAIRAIADWRDDSPMAEVLALARNAKEEKLHVLALRGYRRMVGLGKREVSDAVKKYEAGLDAARRAEEKKLMISGLSKLNQLEAMKAAWSLMGEEELEAEVAAAVVKIGERINSNRERPPPLEAIPILKKLSERIEDEDLVERAQKTIDRLEKRIAIEVEQ